MEQELKARLLAVLNHPLNSELEVLLHAKDRLGDRAVIGNSGTKLYLYCPGTREDRVLLCAHADTVWNRPGHKQVYPILLDDNGVIRSGYSNVGIGADDRAGIAMALELASLGHSVLFTTGEERGMVGASEIKREHALSEFYQEIQGHQFLVQLDRMGSNDFKCYDVGTDAFRAFIAEKTGYQEPNRNSFTDICTLCSTVCGVNFSVGYYNEHGPKEHLVLSEWEHTLEVLTKLLSEDLPRFDLNRGTPRVSRRQQAALRRLPPGMHPALSMFGMLDDDDFFEGYLEDQRGVPPLMRRRVLHGEDLADMRDPRPQDTPLVDAEDEDEEGEN